MNRNQIFPKFRMRLLRIFLVSMVLLPGCASAQTPNSSSPPTQATIPGQAAVVNVMTHDSFAASEDVIRQFEQENNIKINFIPSGDAGSALNRAVLSKDAPLADVFYGVDNTFLSRALDEDIFLPYQSPLLEKIPEDFRLDPQNRALPVDFGDVCLNYDKAYFEKNGLPAPQVFRDLVIPQYKGLLVMENPATSSPGLAFMLATIARLGPQGYLEFWRLMRNNGMVVVNDWETAYYTNFSGSSGRGPQPMVVSYNTSPAAEVIFAETPLDDAPTASVIADGMCFRQIEFVGILKGAKNQSAAEKFVDFMLSVPFQEDMPLQMFVYPVNPEAKLPGEFTRYAPTPEQPASLPPEEIAANRDKWIQDWVEAVLR